MTITFTWQSIITAAAVLGAAVALAAYIVKLVLWFKNQSEQDEKLEAVKQHHDDDMNAIKEEMALIVFGVQACLKGLIEKGCNGPVVDADKQFEVYLNKKAHK